MNKVQFKTAWEVNPNPFFLYCRIYPVHSQKLLLKTSSMIIIWKLNSQYKTRISSQDKILRKHQKETPQEVFLKTTPKTTPQGNTRRKRNKEKPQEDT